MSTELLAWAQITSILAYIGTIFILYRTLVASKDSLIELLREQLSAAEKRQRQLETQTPDQLAETLSQRIQIMAQELSRLQEDGNANRQDIVQRESEISQILDRFAHLKKMLEETDLICPKCSAPLSVRHFQPISGYVGGREVDGEIEYIEYECGHCLRDGSEIKQCTNA